MSETEDSTSDSGRLVLLAVRPPLHRERAQAGHLCERPNTAGPASDASAASGG